MSITQIIKTGFKIIPFPLVHSFSENSLTPIFYHVISDEILPYVKYLYAYRNSHDFEQDIIFMKEYFNFLSYEEVANITCNGNKYPKHSAFISFDDGLKEIFYVVRPILHKHNIPFAGFITTDLIDNKTMLYRHKISLCIDTLNSYNAQTQTHIFHAINDRYNLNIKGVKSFSKCLLSTKPNSLEVADFICELLNTDIDDYLRINQPYLTTGQINTMISEGVSIGAHGKSHIDLKTINKETAYNEIISSARYIKNKFNINNIGFSFPISGSSLKAQWLENILRSEPGLIRLFFESGINHSRPFVIDRICCDFESFEESSNTTICDILKLAFVKRLFNNFGLYSDG